MTQKGGIALILLIIVLIAGLSIGVYLISQNTSWFSNAGSAQITIPYPSPSSASTGASKATYENPFVETETYANPFNEL
jgi:hypothetical protein